MKLTVAPIGPALTVTTVCAEAPARAARLAAMGIVAGIEITVMQRRPAYLLAYEGSIVAIDSEIAAELEVELAAPSPG